MDPVLRLSEVLGDEEKARRIYEFAENSCKLASHGWEHVLRVFELADRLGKKEGADMEILLVSAILHDVGRMISEDKHAIASAKLSENLLRDLGFPEEKIKRIVHCILAHSFSSGISPETLEAKILSDADKLDALGAIGIARVFMYSGEKGRSVRDSIKHFKEKILKLKDLLYTEEAKRIGESRDLFVREFLERLEKELRGED